MQQLSTIGRMDLEARFTACELALAVVKRERDEALRLRDAYLANLTATQKRCTDLLMALRASKTVDLLVGDPEADGGLALALCRLGARIQQARKAHPHGSNLADLCSELGELADALNGEGEERIKDELLDAATIPLRMFMGEVRS